MKKFFEWLITNSPWWATLSWATAFSFIITALIFSLEQVLGVWLIIVLMAVLAVIGILASIWKYLL